MKRPSGERRQRQRGDKTSETMEVWDEVRRSRRHHFHDQRVGCSYFAENNDKEYSKDVKHFGDIPCSINEHKTLRVLGGNIHGIKPTGMPDKISTIAKRLKALQVGHIALQETNTEWNKYAQREAHDSLYKREFANATFQYSTSSDNFDSNCKPGGTASGALGDWVHKVISKGQDSTGCGRWSYITYGGKDQKQLTIISVYRVGLNARMGSTSARKQQHKVMYEDVQLRPYMRQPHHQTLVDLQYLVENFRNEGHDVLVSIDANQGETENYQQPCHEFRGRTGNGFHVNGDIGGSLSEFMRNTGLTNLTTNRHEEQVPNTYIRGKGQIDFLLGSERVITCVEATGLLTMETLASDHCSLYVDLNIRRLLGFEEEDIALRSFSSMRLDDPRISTAYRQELHKQFTHHGVFARVKTLRENSLEKAWDLVDEMLFEQTDKTIGDAMVRAASACTTKKRKEPWAKSISNATHLIRYWSARISRKGGRSAEDAVLDYYRDNAGKHVGELDIELDIDTCMTQGILARQRLKDVLKESKSKTRSYDEEIAAARVDRKFPHMADDEAFSHEREDKIITELKLLGNRNSRKRTHRKLARQIKEKVKPNSTTKSSLNHVLIPTDDPMDTWERVTGKDALEAHLKERNIAQFSEAGMTPFGYTELGKDLGHTGDSALAEDILAGTATRPDLDDNAIRAIVKQLRAHPTIKKILHPIVTLEDFKEAVRLVPERTASSYSGRGIPHYKACAEKTADPLADVLAEVHAAMMSIPLATGYCPTRWKHVIDIMLAKIAGISRTDKLRIIQLLEADLNQVLRIAFARNVSRLAKEHEGVISEHQYGRSESSCMSPVINKLLTIQLLIQKKTEGIVFDNDAKGCYDLIVSGISLATLRRIGFSKESVKLLGTLWAQLQHHIATGYGVSETTYASTAEKLLYGIGQGSCASPILWALLNQLLMAALGDKFDGIILFAANKESASERPGDAFVDDTTTGVTNDDSDLQPTGHLIKCLTKTEEDMVGLMEEIMQFFLDILQVTGGDLAFIKCVWFLVCFRWRHGKAKLLKPNNQHKGINLTSKKTGLTAGIKRKGPTESHTTLGFLIMGNGECTAQKKHMTEKAAKYSAAIKDSTIFKCEAWMAYNTLYLPSVGYGAAATTLSTEDCETIQRPVVNAILPKLKVARSAPRAAIFGTAQFGGMGLAHLAALQGHSRLQYLLGHLRIGDATGKLIRTSIEYVKLECGFSGNPLMKDYNKFGKGILNKNWVTEVWKHLSETESQVDILDLWEPVHGRENDSVIMDTAFSAQFSGKELQDINRCRIYLQAYFVSDIADLDGTQVTAEALKGHRSNSSKSSWAWPVQQRPIAWGAWRKLLGLLATHNYLDKPVGNFKKGHQVHYQVYDEVTRVAYVRTDKEWFKHTEIDCRGRFQTQGELSVVPRDFTHVVQLTRRRNYLEITSKYSCAERAPAHQEAQEQEGAQDTKLPPHITRLMGDEVVWREHSENVILGTDGSVLLGTGYHSWIIANSEGEACVEGGGPDDGDPLLMTSFRSELGGIAGGLGAIGTRKKNGANINKVKVICDNLAAIKRCKRGRAQGIFKATEGDHDLTATIEWLASTWCEGIQIEYEWVKGHADELDRPTTIEEDINIQADAKCDEIRYTAQGEQKASTCCKTWSSEICSLIIRGTKITSNWKERLTQQLLDGKLRDYLMAKEVWTEDTFLNICWLEQERAMKRISTTRRTAIAKVCHNLCYTGKRGNLWTGESAECKLCDCKSEDWRHVITCQSISAELFRADSWNKVKTNMKKWKIPNDMWTAIEAGIRHYMQNPENRHEQTTSPATPFTVSLNGRRNKIRKAFRKQTTIGWENFLKGRLCQEWKEAVQHHYDDNNIKLQVSEWTTKMVLALWDHMQRIWKFRNDTVHKFSSQTVKQYKIDEVRRKVDNLQDRRQKLEGRLTQQQTQHFNIKLETLQFESRRCWANISELYINEIEGRCAENEALSAYLQERGGVG